MRCVVFFHLRCGMTDGSSAYNSGMKTAKYLRRHRKLIGFLAILLSIAMTAGVCLYALTQTAAGSTRLTIVIDAGHGGIDGGVVGRTTGEKESDINLAISQLLQAEFEEAGFLVVQTRPTQAGLYGSATQGYKKRDMQKRAEIIEASAPAAVISVHQNFFSLSSRRGAQVFSARTTHFLIRLPAPFRQRSTVCPSVCARVTHSRGITTCSIVRTILPSLWNADFCPIPRMKRCSFPRIIKGESRRRYVKERLPFWRRHPRQSLQ